MADQWMYRVVGAEFGPVPQDELQQLLQEGLVSNDDEVRPVDETDWRPANSCAELGFQVATQSTSTATAERSSDDWYCKTFGTELGPLGFDELQRMAENGEIAADDEVRLGTNGKWRRIGSIGRLMALLPYQDVQKSGARKSARGRSRHVRRRRHRQPPGHRGGSGEADELQAGPGHRR